MQVRKVHAHFGVEVLDFDTLRAVAPEQIEELRTALSEHQLLLFRSGHRISPERQVEISSWFGHPVSDGGDGKFWSVLRNEEAAGRVRLAFHSDLSFTRSPIQGISLHAIELPTAGTSTSFVSGVHAWASLPPDRQGLLSAMCARHRLASKLFGDWPEFVADHPVRLLHPRSGRPVLYVTEHHAERIHELAPEDSARMLAELFAHLYAPEHVYTHRWESYDLVIWDNLSVQHARREEADPAGGSRVMQRVALNDVPFVELVEHARRTERRRALHS
jgi:taurine dioxygenase